MMLDRALMASPRQVLAHTTQPTQPSPLSIPGGQDLEDELGVDLDMPKPRFSLIFEGRGEDDEDDSFHVPPPRLSLPLDDGDHTERSPELGRRVISENLSGRLSRGSFGTLRMSDRFGDSAELQLDDIAETPTDDSTLRHQMDNIEEDLGDLDGQVEPGLVAFPKAYSR